MMFGVVVVVVCVLRVAVSRHQTDQNFSSGGEILLWLGIFGDGVF